MICIACQWSGEAIGVRSPMPITSRGRYLRNSIASLHAGLERIEQPPIGQVERDAPVDAQRLGRRLGLGQPHLRPRRERRRLAVGEVDHADFVAGVDQAGQRAAAGDLHIVRVGADGDDVERFVRRIGHGMGRPWSVVRGLLQSTTDDGLRTTDQAALFCPNLAADGEGSRIVS